MSRGPVTISVSANIIVALSVVAVIWVAIRQLAASARGSEGRVGQLVAQWDLLSSEQKSMLNVGGAIALFGVLVFGGVVINSAEASFEPLLGILCLVLGGAQFGRGLWRFRGEG